MASKVFMTADGHLDYLAPIQELQSRKAEFTQEPHGAYAQALSTYSSFVGKTDALPPFRASLAHRLVPVAPTLLAWARAASVVILNEAHTQPAHRAYCRQLLEQLAPLGYRYFAVEALDADATGLNERRFPLSSTGFYTCEPSMGKLLRAAAELGYYVVGHEVKTSQQREFADWKRRSNYRDSIQAVNLLAVLRAYPGAKLVVLVGHDHLLEKEQDGFKRLATYLHELGNIDPLTIDQTQPYVAGSATQPQLLAARNGQPVTVGSYAQRVDMQIIHPRLKPVYGRPGWLATALPVVAIIPTPYVGRPVLAQLYDQVEYAQYGEQAIPLDQYLTTATQQQVILFPFDTKRKTLVKYQFME